jgi:hypothetical protein
MRCGNSFGIALQFASKFSFRAGQCQWSDSSIVSPCVAVYNSMLRLSIVKRNNSWLSSPMHPSDDISKDLISCVYPISGTYGLLPRCFFYISLLFALLLRRNEWLVVGCLLSVMTFSGTGAIHAMILTGDGQDPSVVDLDYRVLLVLLSACILSFPPLIEWTRTLRNNSGRRIFELWGALIWVAGMCCIVRFLKDESRRHWQHASTEVACRSSSGELLRTTGAQSGCSYQCLQVSSTTRASGDAIVIPNDALRGSTQNRALLFTVATTLIAMVGVPVYAIAARKRLDAAEEEERLRVSLGPATVMGVNGLKVDRSKTFAQLCFVCLVAAITWSESVYFKELPTNEKLYSIGQWGPWASAALVVAAAVVNWSVEKSSGTKLTTRTVSTTRALPQGVPRPLGIAERTSINVEVEK